MNAKEMEARIQVLEGIVDQLLFRTESPDAILECLSVPDTDATRHLIETWRHRYAPGTESVPGSSAGRQEKERARIFGD